MLSTRLHLVICTFQLGVIFQSEFYQSISASRRLLARSSFVFGTVCRLFLSFCCDPLLKYILAERIKYQVCRDSEGRASVSSRFLRFAWPDLCNEPRVWKARWQITCLPLRLYPLQFDTSVRSQITMGTNLKFINHGIRHALWGTTLNKLFRQASPLCWLSDYRIYVHKISLNTTSYEV